MTSRRPSGLQLGRLRVDRVDRAGALAAIRELVVAGHGGRVFTPNLDHVRLVEDLPALREAYTRASLAIADGMPLVWVSRLFGPPLPERVSGADLVEPLAALAAEHGWRIYLLGGEPGVAEVAARQLRARCGDVQIVGHSAPMVSLHDDGSDAAIIEEIRRCRPDLVFVALGCPKQELFIDRVASALRPAVLIGVGATLDFIAGRVRRAPLWMQRAGLEWLYRLLQEPRRLATRYLVHGPRGLWFLLTATRAAR